MKFLRLLLLKYRMSCAEWDAAYWESQRNTGQAQMIAAMRRLERLRREYNDARYPVGIYY